MKPIPADDVVDFITRQLPVIEEIGASFFEATTAMAFDYFARAGADVAVIEAGLGGRLDSTNVLDPIVAGVTSIGLDHTEYLGTTLEEIAGEKAGIFKPGRAAVIGERDGRIRDLLAEHAREAGASSIRIVADEVRARRGARRRRGNDVRHRVEGRARDAAHSARGTPSGGESRVLARDARRRRAGARNQPRRRRAVAAWRPHSRAGFSTLASSSSTSRTIRPASTCSCRR